MSYDIGLYDKAFLKSAIENGEDDWTDAPKFSDELSESESVKERILEKGYELEAESPICCEYIHSRKEWRLQVAVFSNEISFSLPYWDDADSAIKVAKADAREFSERWDLGLIDQQDGETRI